jgi:hypothetical protein
MLIGYVMALYDLIKMLSKKEKEFFSEVGQKQNWGRLSRSQIEGHRMKKKQKSFLN